MYRWEVFLLVKCQISCKYMHSQLMMIRTMLTALWLFHSHWTPMGWCSFIWIKIPVGLLLCTTGGTKPSSQQRITSEPQTQLGKYLSVSLRSFINCYACNYPGGRAMWWSTVKFSSIQSVFCGFSWKLHVSSNIMQSTPYTASGLGHRKFLPVMLKAWSRNTQCSNKTEIDSIASTSV